jgi:ADP-heptose:LPS heptosyltransferase
VGLTGEPGGPAIHFSGADLARVQALLDEAPSATGPRIAVVARTSNSHPNEWFDDRWIELCGRLIARLGARLVFVGAEADRPDIDRIRAVLPGPSLSAAGRTDIPQLAALMASCDLVVSIDTGGLHVARAVNAPAVVLGHSATPKHFWLPLDQPLYRILLHDHVPCALCHRFTCATRECMQESTVDMVEAAVRDQLAAFPPSAQARADRVAARLA